MNNLKLPLLLLVFSSFIFGCANKESKFPVDKRFWTPEDYDNAIWQLEYRTPDGEEFPRFSSPETSIVIKKLVDQQNYEVILDDAELGLKYKNEVSQQFFDQYRDLLKVYSVMDIQDKFVYPEEFIAIEKFGLDLQIKYFKLGNDRIVEQSDTPESDQTKNVLNSNTQTIIHNFNIYLDNINNEKSFSTFTPSLAEGITVHFFKLIDAFPNANYDGMLNKARLMLKKTQVEEIKEALTKLISKLENMKESTKL